MRSSSADIASHFAEGVARFNEQLFWEAHESWEAIWLEARPEVAPFLQGLIQLAAAWHHLARGNVRGSARLFEAAIARLQHFPADFCGLPREALTKKASAHLVWARDSASRLERGFRTSERIDDASPRIELLPGWRERCVNDLTEVNGK